MESRSCSVQGSSWLQFARAIDPRAPARKMMEKPVKRQEAVGVAGRVWWEWVKLFVRAGGQAARRRQVG